MQTNGAAHHATAADADAPKTATPEQLVDQTIALTIGVFVNGMIGSLAGLFRFDHLVIGMCRLFGAAIGAGMRGNLAQVLKLRAQCKDAFDKAMTTAPISPPPVVIQGGAPPVQG